MWGGRFVPRFVCAHHPFFPVKRVTRKSISEKTLTRRDFMRKSHSAKMNEFNSISLAAKFDAVISRHRQKLYPQTAGTLTLSKSPPPPTHPQLVTVGGFENGSL